MGETKAIRFPREGNEWWPLPPDYQDLTRGGQKLARLNAVSLQETPDDLVTAWAMFRQWYLFPDGATLGFYGSDLTESPPFHYDLIRSIGQYAYNAWACPRGFGKSTLVDEMILLLALTRPAYSLAMCLASDNLVNDRFGLYQTQFVSNERILHDFGVMKPQRGEGAWNQHVLRLQNGSRVRGFAVQGRKRGIKPRPRLLFLDDPEYDPTASTDMTRLREDFDWLLFRVLLPMGQKGMCMFWPGTIITKQGCLWRVCRSDDPQFNRWNRVILAAEEPDATGEMHALWPQLWSMEDLARRKQDLGAAAYAAEMLNRPGVSSEATFQMDPIRHGYVIDGEPNPQAPLVSPAAVHYWAKAVSSDNMMEHTATWGEHVAGMYRMALVDYAYTMGRHSDYSTIVVLGFSRPDDILWVLDVWAGKVRDTELLRRIWLMGSRWRVPVVGIEAVAIQERIFDSASTFLQETADAHGGWMPRVAPIKYPYGVTKQDRIAGMQWRFTADRIKLPFGYENLPHWAMLFQQLREFQAEARDGNLMHDDLADALSMYQQLKRSRAPRSPGDAPTAPGDAMDLLRSGETDYFGTGIPAVLGVRVQDLTRDILAAIEKHTDGRASTERNLGMSHLTHR